MELIRGNHKVEWVELGEGISGDYDPDDNEDIELLRFDVSKLVNGEWEPMDNGSYCTRMPVGADDAMRMRGLVAIMNALHKTSDGGGSVKRTLEEMSWICPDDLPEVSRG